MTRLTLLALSLSACVDMSWGVSDLTVDGDAQFSARVTYAANQWNAALYDRCKIPIFTIVEDGGHPVREYSRVRWKDDGWEGKYLAWYDGNEIAVRANDDFVQAAIIVHELGHAIGLGHVSFEEDFYSVMHATGTELYDPTPGDIERAADALGCP